MRAGWPLAVVCLYAALIPLQPVIALPDGSPLRFAAADVLAPLVFLAGLLRPRRRLPFTAVALAAAIPLLALFSTLWAAIDRPVSMYGVGKTAGLFYLVAVCLAAVRCTDADASPAIVRALASGAFWSAVVGLIGFAAWHEGVPSSLVEGDRLCSTMTGDPNIYGSLLAVGLLLTVADPRWSRPARVLRAVVLATALLAAGSRSAVLGTIAAFAVYGIVRHRDPFVAAARGTVLALAIGLAAALFLTTESGSAGAARVWEHHWRDFTVGSRLELYTRAAEQFAEHPIAGLGVGGFRDLNSFELGGHIEHFVVHDTYLWALVDLGVAGGLLVVGLLGATLWHAVRAARARPPAASAAAVAGGLAAMAVFNLFIDGFYQRHFWVLVACALGMPVRRRVWRPLARAWQHDATASVAQAAAR